jgi:CheY-like chemotaxis protein/HPt (histidine-containing phosphotransfer) domain-containing protein
MTKLDGKSKKELIGEIEELRSRVAELTLISESISYEIRTPLNSIVGFSGMLYKKETDEEKKEFLSHIITSGRSIVSIVDRICPQAPKGGANRGTGDETNAVVMVKNAACEESPKYKILLAEDNSSNAKLISRLLKQFGYEITVVGNGLQAVNAVSRDNFDAVLMDIQMPVMNGKDACAAIRRAGHVMPIIALTACAVRAERDECLKAGMDAFILKPINIDEIESMIKAVIEEKKSTGRVAGDGIVSVLKESAASADGAKPAETPAIKDFDRDKLCEVMSGIEDIMREAVDLLLESAENDMPGIRKAINSKDAMMVKTFAHKLKGSALNACADRAVEILSGIETAAADNDLKKAEELFETLYDAFDDFGSAAKKEGLY